jgi:rRNA processing protein Krr1/Pno1
MNQQQHYDYPELPADKQRIFAETIERVRELANKVKNERLGRFSTLAANNNSTATAIAPPRPRQTVQVLVPVTRASLVVGPQGETLKRLEKMSSTTIVLDQTYSDRDERRFLVTGFPEDIDEAKRLIIDRPLNFSTYPSVNISVPQTRVGLIIGRKGETIREIQEKSGAKVVVSPDMGGQNRERLITVMGEQAAVDRARDMIQEIVFGVITSGASSCLQTIRNSAIMQIPDAATGAVIGKKAETMRGIQEVSGAKLFIDPQPIEGTAIRNVYISGSTEAMAVAQQLITEKVRIVDPTFGFVQACASDFYSGAGVGVGASDQSAVQQQPVMDQQTYIQWMSQYYPQLDQSMLAQYYAQYIQVMQQQQQQGMEQSMYQQQQQQYYTSYEQGQPEAGEYQQPHQ